MRSTVTAASFGKFILWSAVGAGVQAIMQYFSHKALPADVGILVGAAGKALASWVATQEVSAEKQAES